MVSFGNINDLTTVAGWGSIITAAVSTAAIMAVFPRVAGIFAGAFTIITDAYKSKAAEKEKIETGTYQLTMQ